MKLRDFAGKKIEDFVITAFMNMERANGGCFDTSVKFDGKEINHDFAEKALGQWFIDNSSYRNPNAPKYSENEIFRELERILKKCIEKRIQQANNLVDEDWLDTVSE
jgi:hypothetical protein